MNRTMQPEISIEALIAGDRAEFAQLVDTYSSPIYRLGLRMLGNPQDAEDVLQNTFLNALTHLSSFEGSDHVNENEAFEDLKPTQFADWSALPEEELLSSEGKKILDSMIQILP